MFGKSVGIGVGSVFATVFLLGVLGALLLPDVMPRVRASEQEALARKILEDTGVRGGLIVHLGCGDGRLTALLQASATSLVQGLDTDAAKVEAARRRLRALGLYGKISVDRWAGRRLPYIDNLVNLLVVEDPAGAGPDELVRVLAPGGVAYVKTASGWTKTVKRRPVRIDDWTHYLYDSSNNAVAHDEAVGPPRRLQWACGPAWSRHHDHMASVSAMVSSQGRVFYILDEGPRDAILLPARWSLIARDAFNGTLLWKRPIAEWNTSLWPLKSGPNQLPRRLVAQGDRVYVTLGIDAPLAALDAATGKTLLTCAGTDHTEEVLDFDGTLFLLVAHAPNAWKTYRPKSTHVWTNTGRANSQWAWDRAERSIMAIEAASGRVLWKQDRRVAPLTLAADGEQVVFYDGEKVVGLNRRNGNQRWASQPVLRKLPFPTGYGPTLVVQGDVVLLSVESRTMTAFSAADGKKLWTAEHHRGGHMSPDDMLVIHGLVWLGEVANGANSGVFTGRDLHTGEVKSEFKPDVSPDWFHHRCYRSKATDKYFIASRTGIEFIDLEAKHWDFNHWVRSGCLYGFMPANGLVYTTPHSCGCFLESKLFGFNALASEPATPGPPSQVPASERLQRGPAFGEPLEGPASAPEDEWPTYRHDALRSGFVKTAVPAELKRTWQTELGGRLSSVVVAGGRVLVAAIDAHTVHALDAGTGKPAWSYTAGSRVDSPPTVYRGRVLFGSADGWVYCLRATDGQLVWRFLAAPADRRLVASDQVESPWPVSGSVLVQGGRVYGVAGRSAFLDGGMRLFRLDPADGRLLSETRINDRDPETGGNLQVKIEGQDMPVALPDILSSDGRSIYMRAQAFDLEGVRRNIAPLKLGADRRRGQASPGKSNVSDEAGDHLFSRSGFLDDSWFFRSYWMFGKLVDSNYSGWLRPGHFAPSGRLMVLDDSSVYAFARKPEYLCNASVQEYYLYRADRAVSDEAVQRVQAAIHRIDLASATGDAAESDWAVRKRFPLSSQTVAAFQWARGNPPIRARGLVLAGRTLFVAGPPNLVDELEALRNPDDPAIRAKLEAQAAALRGQMGGQILAISAGDGKPLAACELGAMPTFDGLVAARGRLYLSTVDGRVICLGSEGTALGKAPEVKLVALDTSVKPASAEPGPRGGPSPAGEFAKIVRAEITRSDLGYHFVSQRERMGFALKRLPAPLAGKVRLKLRMRVATDGALRNGFLLFGDSVEEPKLIKCGLRFAIKKAVIVQGPLNGGKTVQKPFGADESKVHEVDVAIDLAAGQVAMKTGKVTVRTTLETPLKAITYVGVATLNAATDFSSVETVRE